MRSRCLRTRRQSTQMWKWREGRGGGGAASDSAQSTDEVRDLTEKLAILLRSLDKVMGVIAAAKRAKTEKPVPHWNLHLFHLRGSGKGFCRGGISATDQAVGVEPLPTPTQ